MAVSADATSNKGARRHKGKTSPTTTAATTTKTMTTQDGAELHGQPRRGPIANDNTIYRYNNIYEDYPDISSNDDNDETFQDNWNEKSKPADMNGDGIPITPLQQSNNAFSNPSSATSTLKPHGPPKLPPLAKRIPRPLTLFNETLIDYYHWMHYINQDPDVETYIQAESEYTTAWIAQSGIEALQKQLDQEDAQIKKSMANQPKRGNRLPSDISSNGPFESQPQTQDGPSSSRSDMKKPKVEHLERTQFWDVDRWRYWLDGTVGDYGVFKRRPIPSNAYHWSMEIARRNYMSAQPRSELDLDRGVGLLSQSLPSQMPFTLPPRTGELGKNKDKDKEHGDKVEAIGGCSFEPNITASGVEVVLDVNRLAKRQKCKGGAGQFSFGSIEIQPRHAFLENGYGSRHVKNNLRNARGGGGDSTEGYLAYTYDVSGDERYHIRIMPLPSVSSSGSTPSALSSTLSALNLTSECERRPSPAAFDFDNWCETLDQGQPIMTLEGNLLKDAAAETRWVKLGQELFLYFTRLDPKGLSREVWRVKIETLDPDNQDLGFERDTEDRPRRKPRHSPKLVPEMVMREKDERNVLLISQTNDNRFLLIESSGQMTSCTYFLSIDSPETGWHLVRQAEDNVIYKVEHHSGYFYLRTNHDNSPNFKVLRIPVEYYLKNASESLVETPAELPYVVERAGPPAPSFFLQYIQDEVVIGHDPSEYLERFEVFVEHLVAWVWRGGLQEFRIFQAPRPGEGGGPNADFPLTELQRVRPYNLDFKVATVMPGNIRDEEERLFRNFYSTRLRYSNCSFIHPWALYELDMHDLTPLMQAKNTPEDDDKARRATRLVCHEPFPIGVRYGQSAPEGSLQDTDFLPKDTEKEQEVEMSRYKELRVMVESTHGTKKTPPASNGTVHNDDGEDPDSTKIMIPVSIVYYTYPDGDRFPRKSAFLNAYGAYGTMTSALYDPVRTLPLLRRGLVYVQVHPRGDGVMGSSWYTDGKLENKRNTFYDVEDVLLYLRDSGMVEPGGVVVQGRSAGGLVAGWIANRWGEVAQLLPGSTIGRGDQSQQGDDFVQSERSKPKNIVREMVKVVLAQVPFLDVIAGMSDPDIPWVEYEWSEWGSPLQSREIFEVMKAYSPYDRVRNQPYPAMMVMGGLSDNRVSYAEPLKYVAKLRSIDGKTNDCQSVEKRHEEGRKRMCAGEKETPLLLQMEDGGHFSGSSSLWMAFALYHLGFDKGIPPSNV
ncbi:hypothetical protein BGX33_003964 [Mortierella sp. NVP41]|nr:hypothetical protein BGX33_003964 [Mortierella sp. NVP41]